jgi:hypothetical protein
VRGVRAAGEPAPWASQSPARWAPQSAPLRARPSPLPLLRAQWPASGGARCCCPARRGAQGDGRTQHLQHRLPPWPLLPAQAMQEMGGINIYNIFADVPVDVCMTPARQLGLMLRGHPAGLSTRPAIEGAPRCATSRCAALRCAAARSAGALPRPAGPPQCPPAAPAASGKKAPAAAALASAQAAWRDSQARRRPSRTAAQSCTSPSTTHAWRVVGPGPRAPLRALPGDPHQGSAACSPAGARPHGAGVPGTLCRPTGCTASLEHGGRQQSPATIRQQRRVLPGIPSPSPGISSSSLPLSSACRTRSSAAASPAPFRPFFPPPCPSAFPSTRMQDVAVTRYFNRPDVRAALHADAAGPRDRAWEVRPPRRVPLGGPPCKGPACPRLGGAGTRAQHAAAPAAAACADARCLSTTF